MHNKKLYSIEILDSYTYFTWQVLEDRDEYARSLIVGSDDKKYYSYTEAFNKALEWLVANNIDLKKSRNAKPLNPNKCFCQSQYCKFKDGNVCKKYNKEIIGTSMCDGYEERENKTWLL